MAACWMRCAPCRKTTAAVDGYPQQPGFEVLLTLKGAVVMQEFFVDILHHILGIGRASAVVHGSTVDSIAVLLHCQREYFISGQLSHHSSSPFTPVQGCGIRIPRGHSPYTRLNAPEDCIAGKFYEKLRTQAVCAHSYAIVYHETAKNKRAAKGLLIKNRLRFASSPAGADAPHRSQRPQIPPILTTPSRENAIADGPQAVCYC